MLQPKRVKYRKVHITDPRRVALKGNRLNFGEYGLKALQSKYITARQIEAARVAVTRYLKRGGKVWIRVFPDLSISAKPAETRMGGGKGAPEFWVSPVSKGRILLEVGGVAEDVAKAALRLASFKFACKTRFVKRGVA